MRIKLFITGFAFMALTTMLSAQNNEVTKNQQTAPVTGRAYVDANENGICDNFENGTPAGPYCRRSANFRGRGMGPGNWQGQNVRGQGFGRGQGLDRGQGFGRGQGLGRGRNFVDADKNGVCDFRETPPKK